MSPEARAAGAFAHGEAILAVDRHGHGLINRTYVVLLASGRRLLLQEINRRVFPAPERILANLRTVCDHAAAKRAAAGGAARLRLPGIIAAADGRDFAIDADGRFWRALEFLEGTRSDDTIRDEAQAQEVGGALGAFHALLHDLDPERLHVTLPGFHDTPACLARFERIAAARPADTAELRYAYAFIEARRAQADALERPRREGRLPVRPTHGDPKLSNFLFDERSGRAASLIDLDTVQPGLVHYDLGDCVRSCANRAGECPEALDAVRLDLDVVRALLRGYLGEARGFLTDAEAATLHDAIRLLPFELGLRFLTDHLEGDAYFRTSWRGQNLARALVQFRLVEDIERHGARLRALLAELAG